MVEMEIRGRPGKYIKRNEDGVAFKKVPDMQDMLETRLKNSKTYIDLPFRYIMDATKTAETVEDAEKDLEEQQQRVRVAHDRDQGHRRGDQTIYVERARDDGPPNWQPAMDEMNRRLNTSEDARRQADDKRLQDELAAAQIAAQRHAEHQRLLAEVTANMQSHAHENRALREGLNRPPQVPDPLHHLREAEAHVQRQADENSRLRGAMEGQQAANLAQSAQNQGLAAFIAQHQADISQLAGQLGNGIQSAVAMFMNGASHPPPPQPQVIHVLSGGGGPGPGAPPGGVRIRRVAPAIRNTTRPAPPEPQPQEVQVSSGSGPPPGAPPGAAKIRKAVAAMKDMLPRTPSSASLPIQPASSSGEQIRLVAPAGGSDPRGGPYGGRPPPKPPPAKPPKPVPIPAPPPVPTAIEEEMRNPTASAAKAKAKALVKTKFQTPAGVVDKQKIVDHAKKWTKHGRMPQLAGYIPGTEPGPAPHVPEASQLTYKGDVDLRPKKPTRKEILAKRPMTGQTGPQLAGKRKAPDGDHPNAPNPKKGARRVEPTRPPPAPSKPSKSSVKKPAVPNFGGYPMGTPSRSRRVTVKAV